MTLGWNNLETWQKRLAVIVGTFVAVIALVNYVRAGYDAVYWQHEADVHAEEMVEFHAGDIEKVYSLLAEEKRADRVQRNAREYARLKLKYENEEWNTAGGRDLMKDTLKKPGACDLQRCK